MLLLGILPCLFARHLWVDEGGPVRRVCFQALATRFCLVGFLSYFAVCVSSHGPCLSCVIALQFFALFLFIAWFCFSFLGFHHMYIRWHVMYGSVNLRLHFAVLVPCMCFLCACVMFPCFYLVFACAWILSSLFCRGSHVPSFSCIQVGDEGIAAQLGWLLKKDNLLLRPKNTFQNM